MKDLTVLIPIDKFNEDVKTYLDKCVESVIDQTMKPSELIIITSNEIGDNNKISFDEYSKSCKTNKIKFQLYTHKESTSIQHQINLGVKAVKTKYFSPIEYDDELYYKWFEKVYKNIEYSTENISVYLPIVYNVNKNDKLIRFSNELVWSAALAEEGLGYLDEEMLLMFLESQLMDSEIKNYFQIMGGVIKTEDFTTIGSLKEDLKLFFWDELLIRFTHNKYNAYVIPKFGYLHRLSVTDSFTERVEKDYSLNEIKEWINTIKEEYTNNGEEPEAE